MDSLAVRSEEQQLDALAIELFTNHESHFTPTHPWCFVRVLPREQRYGLLILPDGKQQNKPVHEGIILVTWKPFTARWRQKVDGQWVDCEKEIKSDFEIGDHVLYPHHAGMNAAHWDERYYRLVPEHTRAARGIDNNGIIFGKLNYPKSNPGERLQSIILENIGMTAPHERMNTMKAIQAEFDVISKEGYSKTVSGK